MTELAGGAQTRLALSLEFKVEVLRLVKEGKKAIEAIAEANTAGLEFPKSYSNKNAGSHIHRFRAQLTKLLKAGDKEAEALAKAAGLLEEKTETAVTEETTKETPEVVSEESIEQVTEEAEVAEETEEEKDRADKFLEMIKRQAEKKTEE